MLVSSAQNPDVNARAKVSIHSVYICYACVCNWCRHTCSYV